MPLDEELAARLAERFTDRVVDAAALPPSRARDVSASLEVSRDGNLLRLTCSITGSIHERTWDGQEGDAVALVDEAADDTAYLIAKTPRYAWLRSQR